MKRVLLALVLTATASAASSSPAAYLSYAEQMANRYAAEYGVPAAMIRAVIRVESGWNPGAVSSKGAIGLMQLMPGTARALRVKHLYWIYSNIRGGTAYLAYLHRRFQGDWRLALAAYVAGPAAIERRGLRYSSREVFVYVTRVLAVYRAELRREKQ
ncbi:MAG: lytic transglycosylase domain-containing protein [Bryobacteraceae bacterium]